MDVIGVIGAGVMGSGVAQSFAQAGMHVVLIDITQSALDKSKDEIVKNIRFQTLLKKNTNSEKTDMILPRINFTTDYQELKNVNFIVENIPEKWELKSEVYRLVDEIAAKDCIFGANTSCISITRIASLVKRPDKVIGIHFMNPVPAIEAVEVMKGYHTSKETIAITEKLLEKIGKECIVVDDFPGFVSNRISHLFMNEAAFIVQDQVATPENVDQIFRQCYGHKMGPLETADLIGLDTVVNSLDVLYESYQDSKFRCCPLLRKMVDAGLYGRKSGKGFYNYYY